jgi:hypothetical protein
MRLGRKLLASIGVGAIALFAGWAAPAAAGGDEPYASGSATRDVTFNSGGQAVTCRVRADIDVYDSDYEEGSVEGSSVMFSAVLLDGDPRCEELLTYISASVAYLRDDDQGYETYSSSAFGGSDLLGSFRVHGNLSDVTLASDFFFSCDADECRYSLGVRPKYAPCR